MELVKHGIYLRPAASDVDPLVGLADAEGRTVLRSDLRDVGGKEQLLNAFQHDLMIPHPVSGYDALLSLLANLEWIENPAGYLILFEGLDGLRKNSPSSFNALASILPDVSDRWRTIGTACTFLLTGSLKTLKRARAELDKANDGLARAGLLPWIDDVRPAEIFGPGGDSR